MYIEVVVTVFCVSFFLLIGLCGWLLYKYLNAKFEGELAGFKHIVNEEFLKPWTKKIDNITKNNDEVRVELEEVNRKIEYKGSEEE